MVQVRDGDLFASSAQTLVNTVNCVGVMGKGIALTFKKLYPEMFRDYEARCKRRQVKLGEPYLFRQMIGPWILNFPTKDHWRSVSNLANIERGLDYLEAHYQEWGITSLAVPPLGCGNGGLDWRVVGPTLYRRLARFSIPVELYPPIGTPAAELTESFLGSAVGAKVPKESVDAEHAVSPAAIALVEVLRRIHAEPYHWPVGRTVFQKLAYFVTCSGVPTGLRFARGSFGPFSADLKPLQTRLINNGLLEEHQRGRSFEYCPGPTFQDAARRLTKDLKAWESEINRVTDLFLRVRTQEAEVIATVKHATQEFVQRGEPRPTERAVLDAVMDWKQRRKPPLRDDEVADAIRQLALLGWIDVRPSQDLPIRDEALIDDDAVPHEGDRGRTPA